MILKTPPPTPQPPDPYELAKSREWKTSTINCGNCTFWELAGYQSNYPGAAPYGISGPGTDGTISECRRHAPVSVDQNRYPGRTAIFPKTERIDHCGDFEAR